MTGKDPTLYFVQTKDKHKQPGELLFTPTKDNFPLRFLANPEALPSRMPELNKEVTARP